MMMAKAKIRMYRFLVEMDSQEEIILKQNNIIRELTTENLRLLNIIESQ